MQSSGCRVQGAGPHYTEHGTRCRVLAQRRVQDTESRAWNMVHQVQVQDTFVLQLVRPRAISSIRGFHVDDNVIVSDVDSNFSKNGLDHFLIPTNWVS